GRRGEGRERAAGATPASTGASPPPGRRHVSGARRALPRGVSVAPRPGRRHNPGTEPRSPGMTSTQPAPSVAEPRLEESVFIRPWPKVVFLYPTFFAAILACLLTLLKADARIIGN